MYRRHGDKLTLVFLACDLAVTTVAWIGAYSVRFGLVDAPGGIPDFDLVLRGLPLVLMLAGVAYRACGLYEIHRLRQLPREAGVVFRASGLMFLLAITLTFYRRDLYESRLALTLFLLLNPLGLMSARRLLWRVLKHLRGRGLNHGRALVVGKGRIGRMVVQTIRANRWTGLEAVGYVDEPGKIESTDLPRLGTVSQLKQLVAEHDIDHVFVALPLARYAELPLVYAALADVFVEIQLVPDLPQLAGMRLRMTEIDQVAFLSLREDAHRGWLRLAKRSMDLVFGTAALVLALPLMVFLAAAIRLTSPGPVFYRQTRLGLRGRPFAMLKFRSMRVEAESASGPVWTRRHDSRRTPLGRFMRRWSLDELPQLINVLAGDMSLVGPRPERGVFVEKFRKQLPSYGQRHQMPAGMTGWAQIHGWRGDSSLRRRLACDLYYVTHWSLWLDLQILALTPLRGLRTRSET